jgi:hypothetical protein
MHTTIGRKTDGLSKSYCSSGTGTFTQASGSSHEHDSIARPSGTKWCGENFEVVKVEKKSAGKKQMLGAKAR